MIMLESNGREKTDRISSSPDAFAGPQKTTLNTRNGGE